MAAAEIRPDWTIGTLNLTSGSVEFTTNDSMLQTAAIQPGDEIITASGLVLIIASITGQNSGTLMEPCPADAAGSGQPLRIRFQPDGSRYNGATADLVQLLGSGNVYEFAGLQGVPDGVPVFTGAGTMEIQGKDTFVTPDPNGNLAELSGWTADQVADAATAVSYGPQTLTEAQQVQVRQNIQADKSYDSITSVAAATVPAFANAIRTNGYYAAGDGGGALYKRVTSEPSHAGKVQSADGAWWELGEAEINPLMFGAKGDGVTDDVAALYAALDYFRNPSTAGLPGNLPYRNLRRTLDLAGRVYAISSGLHLEHCYGLHLTNGTLIAIGTSFTPESVMIWAANPATGNFNNFSISKLTLQCNQKCSGILLHNSSLYQLTDIYIYGWGATGSSASFGLQSLPAGWSSSASIHNVVALPYITSLDENPSASYTGVGFILGHNDCIVTGCEVAAGYCAVRFPAGAAAIQFNDNHTWILNPGNNPGVEINGNFGIVLNGNYFDSHPVWVKGAGYYGITITNNFFLSGSPSPTGAVILESPSAAFELRDIVITGNTGSGGMTKVVETYSPSGTSFSTNLRRVVVKDNPISTSANSGHIHPTATEGTVSVFVETGNLSANFTTRVPMANVLLTTNVPSTRFKATFGLTQNDASMADTFVGGYYYNQTTGHLHIKLNRSVPCFVTVNFKIDEFGPNLNAVPL